MQLKDLLVVLTKLYVLVVLGVLSYYFFVKGLGSLPSYFKYLTLVAALVMLIISVTVTIEGYQRTSSPVSSPCKNSTSPKYPGTDKSKELYAYIEDASDRQGMRCYNPTQLENLGMFGFDISDNANEGSSVVETLQSLAKTCDIVVHVDSSAGSIPQATSNQGVFAAMKDFIESKAGGSTLVDKANTLLFETENSTGAYKVLAGDISGNSGDLISASQTASAVGFKSLNTSGEGLITWSTTGTSPLANPKRGNIIVEAYNVYTKCALGLTCLVDFIGVHGGCSVNLKSTDRYCFGDASKPLFPTKATDTMPLSTDQVNAAGLVPCKGVCASDKAKSPSDWKCKIACDQGDTGYDYCCTRPNWNGEIADCNEVVNFGGGIYNRDLKDSKGSDVTATARGAWLGQILGIMLGGDSHNASADKTARAGYDGQYPFYASGDGLSFTSIIFLPFTSGSCPSLRGVITTPSQFDDFCAGVRKGMSYYVEDQYQDDVKKIRFGAWGCPDFLLMN